MSAMLMFFLLTQLVQVGAQDPLPPSKVKQFKTDCETTDKGLPCVQYGLAIKARLAEGSEPLGWFVKACDRDHVAGCTLAIMETVPKSMDPAWVERIRGWRKKANSKRNALQRALDGDIKRARAENRGSFCPHFIRDLTWRACIEQNDLGACTLQALMRALDLCGYKRQQRVGFSMMSGACRRGHPVACALLSDLAIEENPSETNHANARILTTIACTLGYDRSCLDLGMVTKVGIGGPKDHGEARRQFKRLCDLNNHQACGYLADMLMNGQGGPKDLKEAIRLYSIRCEVGYDNQSCAALATALEKPGPTRDFPRSRSILEKACKEQKAWGCRGAAIHHAKALGTKKDLITAKEFLDWACKLGDTPSCKTLKRLNTLPK